MRIIAILALLIPIMAIAQNAAISQMPSATVPLNTGDLVPLAQPCSSTATGYCNVKTAVGNVAGAPGATINAISNGVVCDGITDNGPKIAAINATLIAGDGLYFPPATAACLTSVAIAPISNTTVYAIPGTVIIKPTSGNTANPLLLAVANVSHVSVIGITFDGGGTAFASSNNVVSTYASSYVNFDHVTVQNTRGIGMIFSASTQSGATHSTFINIGNYYTTSGLSTDRKQALAFCCSSPQQPVANYATHDTFSNIGLDSISITNNNDFVASENHCELSLSQLTYNFTNNAACIYESANTGITMGKNISNLASGNAFDNYNSTNVTLTGNIATGSGGGGFAFSVINNFSVTGNIAINNGQWASNCELGGFSFADANSIGSVTGNVSTDTQVTPTQQYGIYEFTGCSHPGTLTNVLIDQTNELDGNKTAQYGGLLSAPTTWALSPTQTGNWTFAPTSGQAVQINGASGNFGLLIEPNGSSDGQAIVSTAGNSASLRLRGNGNPGSAGFVIDQDGSSIAHLSQLANSPLDFDVNGTNTVFLPPTGGVGIVAIAIGSLPSCNSGANVGVRLTVNNGITSPTYQQTVSSTGSVTQPVYCNGTNWVYD